MSRPVPLAWLQLRKERLRLLVAIAGVAFAVVLIFVLVSTDPPLVLFSVSLCFALSGPVLTLMQIRKRRAERRRATDATDSPARPD